MVWVAVPHSLVVLVPRRHARGAALARELALHLPRVHLHVRDARPAALAALARGGVGGRGAAVGGGVGVAAGAVSRHSRFGRLLGGDARRTRYLELLVGGGRLLARFLLLQRGGVGGGLDLLRRKRFGDVGVTGEQRAARHSVLALGLDVLLQLHGDVARLHQRLRVLLHDGGALVHRHGGRGLLLGLDLLVEPLGGLLVARLHNLALQGVDARLGEALGGQGVRVARGVVQARQHRLGKRDLERQHDVFVADGHAVRTIKYFIGRMRVKVSDEMAAKVAELHGGGKSIRAIAAEFGVPRSTIGSILNRQQPALVQTATEESATEVETTIPSMIAQQDASDFLNTISGTVPAATDADPKNEVKRQQQITQFAESLVGKPTVPTPINRKMRMPSKPANEEEFDKLLEGLLDVKALKKQKEKREAPPPQQSGDAVFYDTARHRLREPH
jgi:hypothetical protein